MFYTPESDRKWRIFPVYDSDHRLMTVLSAMEKHEHAPGYSDVGIRNLIYTSVINLSPRRVLEIGCHIGSGAVVIGSALRKNEYGRLFTLEPNPVYEAIARQHVSEMELDDHVTIVPRFSHDDECKAILRNEAPFEIIFVDGAHDYASAYADIELSASLLHDNGFVILHDTGRVSPDMDVTKRGGVRKALHDFAKATPDMSVLYYEHPLWMNPCGAAILSRQKLEPAI